MKITKQQLKQIIKEEIEEAVGDPRPASFMADLEKRTRARAASQLAGDVQGEGETFEDFAKRIADDAWENVEDLISVGQRLPGEGDPASSKLDYLSRIKNYIETKFKKLGGVSVFANKYQSDQAAALKPAPAGSLKGIPESPVLQEKKKKGMLDQPTFQKKVAWVKKNKPKVKDPEAYVAGTLRKTGELKEAAKDYVWGVKNPKRVANKFSGGIPVRIKKS